MIWNGFAVELDIGDVGLGKRRQGLEGLALLGVLRHGAEDDHGGAFVQRAGARRAEQQGVQRPPEDGGRRNRAVWVGKAVDSGVMQVSCEPSDARRWATRNSFKCASACDTTINDCARPDAGADSAGAHEA